MEEKEKMLEYRQAKNSISLDGLGGMRAPRRAQGQSIWVRDFRSCVRRAGSQKEGFVMGVVFAFLLLMVWRGIGLDVF